MSNLYVLRKVDIRIIIYDDDTLSPLVGYNSNSLGENDIEFTPFRWDNALWTSETYANLDLKLPVLTTKNLVGLSDDFWNNGVANKDKDLELLKIKEVRDLDGKKRQTVQLRSGAYYIQDKKRYLFSDRSEVQVVDQDDNASSRNKLLLNNIPKYGTPIKAYMWQRDKNLSISPYYDFQKRARFTGKYNNNGQLPTVDENDAIIWNNVDTSKKEFIVSYDSGEDAAPTLYFNDDWTVPVSTSLMDSYFTTDLLEGDGDFEVWPTSTPTNFALRQLSSDGSCTAETTEIKRGSKSAKISIFNGYSMFGISPSNLTTWEANRTYQVSFWHKGAVGGESIETFLTNSAYTYWYNFDSEEEDKWYQRLMQINYSRDRSASVKLDNGNVLITGGLQGSTFTNTCELFNCKNGKVTYTTNMNTARDLHSAVKLNNGMILVVGGQGGSSTYLSSCELYNPYSASWTYTGSMSAARCNHSVTVLNDGRVIAIGGVNGSGALGTTEIYNPDLGTWSAGPNIGNTFQHHNAVKLLDGRVLIAGGYNGGTCSQQVYIYNPTTNSFTRKTDMNVVRDDACIVLLASGKVLVAGGYNGSSTYYNTAEVYDPDLDTWTYTSNNLSEAKDKALAIRLNNNKVLIMGGRRGSSVPTHWNKICRLYNPDTNAWETANNLYTESAWEHSRGLPIMLDDGRVFAFTGVTATAARYCIFYNEDIGTWDTGFYGRTTTASTDWQYESFNIEVGSDTKTSYYLGIGKAYDGPQAGEEIFYIDDLQIKILDKEYLKTLEFIGTFNGDFSKEIFYTKYFPIHDNNELVLYSWEEFGTQSTYRILSRVPGVSCDYTIDLDTGEIVLIERNISTDDGQELNIKKGTRLYIAYRSTIEVQYEPEYSNNTTTAIPLELNVLKNGVGQGVLYLTEEQDYPASIEIMTDRAYNLPSASTKNTFGPIYTGNDYVRITATVLDSEGNGFPGQKVEFYFDNTTLKCIGMINNIKANSEIEENIYIADTVVTDEEGKATVVYVQPEHVGGDAVIKARLWDKIKEKWIYSDAITLKIVIDT